MTHLLKPNKNLSKQLPINPSLKLETNIITWINLFIKIFKSLHGIAQKTRAKIANNNHKVKIHVTHEKTVAVQGQLVVKKRWIGNCYSRKFGICLCYDTRESSEHKPVIFLSEGAPSPCTVRFQLPLRLQTLRLLLIFFFFFWRSNIFRSFLIKCRGIYVGRENHFFSALFRKKRLFN